METFKVIVVLPTLTIAVALSSNIGRAQDYTVAGFERVNKAEGLYEYNEDGVPVLGLVTGRTSNDRVKFTMCNNVTMEVDFKQLKSSGGEMSWEKQGPWHMDLGVEVDRASS